MKSSVFAIGLLIIGSVQTTIAQSSSDVTSNKERVTNLINQHYNHKNMEMLDEIIHADFRAHNAGKVVAHGKVGYKNVVQSYINAFPDLQISVEDIIGEGNMIATRQTYRGTHYGSWMNIPATGNEVVWTGISFFRLVDTLIIEEWTEYDLLGIMLQIGGFPMDPSNPQTNRSGVDFLWTAQSTATGASGTPESNKTIVSQMMQSNDETMVASTLKIHDPLFPEVITRDDFLEWNKMHDPLLSIIVDMIAEDSVVASRWEYSWNDLSVQKRITLYGNDFYRCVDNQIVDRWSSKDFLSMFMQYDSTSSATNWFLYQ